MSTLTCHVCGRVLDLAALDELAPDERRCPRCGAHLDDPARAAAAAQLPARIAFLGFGLIGGSVAAALRAAGSGAHLVGWTPGGSGPAEGLRRGILDEAEASPEAAVDGAGLVILAGPPLAIVAALSDRREALAAAAAAGATITDVGSTKRRIVEAAGAAGIPFVGGHPMAGRETTGAGAAVADLFHSRPWVVVPGATSRPRDIEVVEALARATGARPIRLAADEHDAAVAAISHLPLVVSASLVESVAGSGADAWALARSLAAGGWADTTRLTKGDPEMGAGILATNALAVADRLRALRNVIDEWIAALDPGTAADPAADPATLRARLASARDALLAEEPK